MHERGKDNTRKKEPVDNSWGPARAKLEHDINVKRSSVPHRPKGLDLQHLDLLKEPKDAATSLEFLICTLASKLELKPSQVGIGS